MAKNLMIQGTMSGVGKSILTAGLLRVLKQDGYRAAPFKSQNMALNSFVTKEGLEMGRAQVLQAQAAGREPLVCMNPILLKPTNDTGSQVIVNGEVMGNMSAREYFSYKKKLVPVILEAYRKLEATADIIVLEGAGSPAEINLKQEDIVNMGLAELVDAPVLLAGDIDRGGVFAQLIGTVQLLEPEERARVKGLIINKFRGDKTLLEPGISMLEEKCGIPVTGILPYLQLDLEEEDSLAERLNGNGQSRPAGRLEGNDCGGPVERLYRNGQSRPVGRLEEKEYSSPAELLYRSGSNSGLVPDFDGGAAKGPGKSPAYGIDIAVLKVPHISNFTDFDQLAREPGVTLRYVDRPSRLGVPDAVLLPGSKNTMADLLWLRNSGLEAMLQDFSRAGGPVFGICGGYQMLGQRIEDPDGTEEGGVMEGIGLLPVRTVFAPQKVRCQTSGRVKSGLPEQSIWQGLAGADFTGYEIHMGRTEWTGHMDEDRKACCLAETEEGEDGCICGNTAGTYVHGIFDEGGFRQQFLQLLFQRKGADFLEQSDSLSVYRERQLDLLAEAVRAHMDMEAVYRIIGITD